MNLQETITTILEKNPGTLPSEIARQLKETELNIIRNLPEGMATELPCDQFEPILKEIKEWGSVTTIIEVAGCIFEIKCPFPDGSNKFGYYNLMTKGNPFQGHLKAENICAIALVSKLFHGVMTHSISFFDNSGKGIFKIYLGRNTDRSFIEGQEQHFESLKNLAMNSNTER
jgi:putative heme utilization carrier protein HutX